MATPLHALRDARLRQGKTLDAVAGAADEVDVGFLSRLERGFARVAPDRLEALARAYGVEPDLLVPAVRPRRRQRSGAARVE
jgi:transcriptional regulator with XRE-family HTH domain